MCISWTINCLILLMHGASMKFICTDLLKQVDKEENVLKLISISDETLVCGYSFKQSSSLHNGSRNVAQNEEKKVTQQIAYDDHDYCLL